MSETRQPENHGFDDEKVAKLMNAARRAVRAAVREHKLLGNPIAAWRDGKVILIPPDKIEV